MSVKLALLIAFSYCTLMENAFAVTYMVGSPWRLNLIGRNMAAYAACVAGISDLLVLSLWIRYTMWLLLIGYILLGAAVTHRYVLLLRAQHHGRVERKRHTAGL